MKVERYLTTEQVAERLALAPDTVREMCKANKIAHVRIGRRIRVSELTLREFLKMHYRPAITAKGMRAGEIIR